MSWPQWPMTGAASAAAPAGNPPLPGVTSLLNTVVNPAPPVMPATTSYTHEQWAQMQQQNWQQWAQWQQQYQQWHQQYGAEYQKMTAMNAGYSTQPALPSMPNMGVPPPPPVESKPPPPPSEPPADVSKVNMQSYSTQPHSYSTGPPPGYNMNFPPPQNAQAMGQMGYRTQNQQMPAPPMAQQQNWQQMPVPQPPQQQGNNKRPYGQQDDFGDPKRQMMDTQGSWKQGNPPNPANQTGQGDGRWNQPATPVPPPSKTSIEELSEAEKRFDKQFAEWEAQFNKWKDQNANHPDKEQYREYEKKWENWRNQLLERREQMRRKRLGLLAGKTPSSTPPTQTLTETSKKQAQLQNNQASLSNQQDPSAIGASFNEPKPPQEVSQSDESIKPNQGFEPQQPSEGGPEGTFLSAGNESGGGDFLKTSTSGGIPGLDLVKDDDAHNDNPEGADKEPEKKGADMEALSKGINSILGDPKLMNMLSMVSHNQTGAGTNLTNTTSKIGDGTNPVYPTQQPNQLNNSFDGRSGTEESAPQRDFVNNFDDQTRSSFTAGMNEQDNMPFNQGGFGQNQNQFNRFDKEAQNNKFGGQFGPPPPPPFSGQPDYANRRGPDAPGRTFGGPTGQDFFNRPGPDSSANTSRVSDGPGGNFGGPPGQDFHNRPGADSARPNTNFAPNANFSCPPPDFGRQGPDFGRQGPDFGRQGPNFGRQGPDFGRQGPDFGGQGPDFGGQGSDFGGQGPDFGGQGPDFGRQGPGFGRKGPDFGNKGPDFGNKGPDFGNKGPDFGNKGPDFGNKGPSFGRQGPDFGRQEPNFGNQGQDFGRPGSDSGRQGPDFGRQGAEFGRQGPDIGRQGSDSGRQGPDFGRQAPDFGRQGANYGRQGSDFGRPNSDFGRQGPGFGRQDSDFGRQGPDFGRQGPDQERQGSGPDFGRNSDFSRQQSNYGNRSFGPSAPSGKFSSDLNRNQRGSFDDQNGGFGRGYNDPKNNFNSKGDYGKDRYVDEGNLGRDDFADKEGGFERDSFYGRDDRPEAFPPTDKTNQWENDDVSSHHDQLDRESQPPADPAPPKPDDVLTIEKVIDYDHKPLKTDGEFDVTVEPFHMFDYRHKPLNRIPYPQRPKWLFDTVRNIMQFEPLISRPTDQPHFGRYERLDSWKADDYRNKQFNDHHKITPFDDKRPHNDGFGRDSREIRDIDRQRNAWDRNRDDMNRDRRGSSRERERDRFRDDDRDRDRFRDDERNRDRFRDEDGGRGGRNTRDDRRSFGNEGRRGSRERDRDGRESYEGRGASKGRENSRGREHSRGRDEGNRNRSRSRDDHRRGDRPRGRDSSYDRKHHEGDKYKERRDQSNDKRSDERRDERRGDSRRSDDRRNNGKDRNNSKDNQSSRKNDKDHKEGDFTKDDWGEAENTWEEGDDQPHEDEQMKLSQELGKIEASKPTYSNTTMIQDLLCPPGRFNRPARIVIILRGPPGSGKSFLAKLIKDKEVENGGSAPRILCLDDYFMVEQEKEVVEDGKKTMLKEMVYEYEQCMEEAYRASLMKAFKKTITDGYFSFIIVDNINDKVKYFGEMWSFAKQNGFQVYISELDLDVQVCTKRNIHNRSEEDIQKCVDGWEPTPAHHPILDATSLVQAGSITEVEMEEINSPQTEQDDAKVEDEVARSKWDAFDCSVDNLAKLDGISKPLRPSRTMEEYLQLDEWTPAKPTKPGQKRVRWADLEECKQQEKMRAIGFVVGQTNWDRMMDSSMGSNALTQTKYFERTSKY